MTKNEINFAVANDSGNGFVKNQTNNQRIKFPSVLAEVIPGSEPMPIDETDTRQVATIFSNLFSHMDITIDSPKISGVPRYLVGDLANTSFGSVIGFNVSSVEGKADSEIGLVTLLAQLAYRSLEKYYLEYQELPNPNELINVKVPKMTTALPINEYKQAGVKEKYAQKFIGKHKVTINTFTHPLNFEIIFDKVDVEPEGVVAVSGLVGNPTDPLTSRNDGVFDDFKKEYDIENFDGKNILETKRLIVIDVGDGTVDITVIVNGVPISNLTQSLQVGTGVVQENAIKALKNKYPTLGNMSRQTFMDLARQNNRQGHVFTEILNSELSIIERPILEQIKTIFANNAQNELVIVCGGGASLLKDHFKPILKKNLEKLNVFGAPPLLWVPPKYAQYLNLDGLAFRLAWVK
ncbi:ParM/StbA family protein (plasmid) [Lactobacillus sp. PV037]|uniref:ParM/StbA family protein n=1 Tax=Lactobacillus sp. PV037 TaxID=2594496 RepID=UPI00223FFC38|nr:ParM/StbA family protein [Lactobacillus sp. PV037]QNQ82929.1 ParM/StbA family protein [Lactobacillus sp. PV037]